MPAPLTLITTAEMEAAIGAKKLRELLPAANGRDWDSARVERALLSGWGAVRGAIDKALAIDEMGKPTGITTDLLWDTWAEVDKAEIKRLALGADFYYCHYYGEAGEAMPDEVSKEFLRILEQAQQVGNRSRSLGASPVPAFAQQADHVYARGPGQTPPAAPRWGWRGF